MKILFLDVDGVLNKENTKEYIFEADIKWTGLDAKLLKLYLDWIRSTDTQVILSSSWRNFEVFCAHLIKSGVEWIDMTPRLIPLRGDEIQVMLDKYQPERYAILDDYGHDQFLKHQRRYLVQTSPRHGIEPKKIKKLNEILYG